MQDDCEYACRPLNPSIARNDFPILKRILPTSKPLVYLDNAATTQKPQAVIDATDDYYSRINSNVHRAVHTLAGEATEAYEDARRRIAKWFGLSNPNHLIFTSGTTEAINLVAHGWGRANLKQGDVIVTTEMEHHANIVPWQLLAKERGLELRHIPMADDFRLNLSNLDSILDGAKLLCFVHTSNVLGTANPVDFLIKKAKDVGAKTVIDGAQAVAHDRIGFDSLGADFFAMGAHKMVGPTGIGGLMVSPDAIEEMQPFLAGGDMIEEVFMSHATWAKIPYKFEAGTPKIAQAVGWGAAVDWLSQWDMHSLHMHALNLARRARAGLDEIAGIKVYGDQSLDENSGVISFLHESIHANDLAMLLDTQGIAVRTGHHCAQPLMRKLGVPATNRASFYLYNTEEEADAFVNSLKRAVMMF